jgi:hypothetical protein
VTTRVRFNLQMRPFGMETGLPSLNIPCNSTQSAVGGSIQFNMRTANGNRHKTIRCRRVMPPLSRSAFCKASIINLLALFVAASLSAQQFAVTPSTLTISDVNKAYQFSANRPCTWQLVFTGTSPVGSRVDPATGVFTPPSLLPVPPYDHDMIYCFTADGDVAYAQIRYVAPAAVKGDKGEPGPPGPAGSPGKPGRDAALPPGKHVGDTLLWDGTTWIPQALPTASSQQSIGESVPLSVQMFNAGLDSWPGNGQTLVWVAGVNRYRPVSLPPATLMLCKPPQAGDVPFWDAQDNCWMPIPTQRVAVPSGQDYSVGPGAGSISCGAAGFTITLTAAGRVAALTCN